MRARALFAHMDEGDGGMPILVAAMDETIWEHLDEDPWVETRNEWPDEYEWREAWIDFDHDIGMVLFPPAPEITAVVSRADEVALPNPAGLS